jgi:hypothetical protein
MQKESPGRLDATTGDKIWSRNLIILAVSVFLLSLGMGLQNGVNTNFIKELGLSGSQVLMQSGIREIPGLALVFLAAMIMHLPLVWRSVASVLIMGLGFALYRQSWLTSLYAVKQHAGVKPGRQTKLG